MDGRLPNPDPPRASEHGYMSNSSRVGRPCVTCTCRRMYVPLRSSHAPSKPHASVTRILRISHILSVVSVDTSSLRVWQPPPTTRRSRPLRATRAPTVLPDSTHLECAALRAVASAAAWAARPSARDAALRASRTPASCAATPDRPRASWMEVRFLFSSRAVWCSVWR